VFFPRKLACLQVRDHLAKLALDGNHDVSQYGDMITDEATCTRFLRGGKGVVSKAVDMFKGHLEWRVKYKLDKIADEDFSDLKEHGELYWGGMDKEGVMTLMWRLHLHDAKRTDAKRFVRFFVHQIESGLRTCPSYPNCQFNIGVDLDQVVRSHFLLAGNSTHLTSGDRLLTRSPWRGAGLSVASYSVTSQSCVIELRPALALRLRSNGFWHFNKMQPDQTQHQDANTRRNPPNTIRVGWRATASARSASPQRPLCCSVQIRKIARPSFAASLAACCCCMLLV